MASDTPARIPPLAEATSIRLIAEHGTGLDPYRLTDAVWLADLPVAVNEEFDFSAALGLDIGPGIAAAKRQQNNAAKAKTLNAAQAVDRDAEENHEAYAALASQLDAWRRCGIHAYGLLWGNEEAELWLVLDAFDARGERVHHEARKLAARRLDGDDGWLRSVGAIVKLLGEALTKPRTALATM